MRFQVEAQSKGERVAAEAPSQSSPSVYGTGFGIPSVKQNALHQGTKLPLAANEAWPI